jgi:hypothetical protein
MNINKKILFIACLLSGVVVLASMTLIQQEREEPKPTNLKVLPKNISHKDLERVMGNWAQALGVRCNFCHARNDETKKTDFASDAKPEKLMARKMYLMAGKINRKYFKADKKDSLDMLALSSVNCYTCHHGVAHLDKPIWPKRQQGPGGPGGPGGMNGMPPTEKKM